MRDAATIPIASPQETPWKLPYRGTVGMACLIVAESAIFVIFVVAYIFYMGKSLTGPTPMQVLELPIFGTICLLSSSITVHFAVAALRKGKLRGCTGWTGHGSAGIDFPYYDRPRVVSPDLRRRTDDTDQSFWDHLLFAGWTARDARCCRPHHAFACSRILVVRTREGRTFGEA